MRRIREILRLHHECQLTQRQISASTGVSKGAISDYLRRAHEAGLTWEQARLLDDTEVEHRLFRLLGRNEPPRRAPIDFAWVHRELRRVGVTLQQLWFEYREAAASGPQTGCAPYSYSQFCDLYAAFRGKVDVTMRQVHLAGEKVFIDYSGKKSSIVDSVTGEVTEVELFVAVLGASNYTFAEATRTQTLPDFCASTGRLHRGPADRTVVPCRLRPAGHHQRSNPIISRPDALARPLDGVSSADSRTNAKIPLARAVGTESTTGPIGMRTADRHPERLSPTALDPRLGSL
jgi:hypothetical protein